MKRTKGMTEFILMQKIMNLEHAMKHVKHAINQEIKHIIIAYHVKQITALNQKENRPPIVY